MTDVQDDPKDVIVNVTGVSISTDAGINNNDSERDPAEDHNGASVEESSTGD